MPSTTPSTACGTCSLALNLLDAPPVTTRPPGCATSTVRPTCTAARRRRRRVLPFGGYASSIEPESPPTRSDSAINPRPDAAFVPPLAGTDVGLGLENSPASSAAAVSADQVGQAPGISNMVRFVGESLAVAVASSPVAHRPSSWPSPVPCSAPRPVLNRQAGQSAANAFVAGLPGAARQHRHRRVVGQHSAVNGGLMIFRSKGKAFGIAINGNGGSLQTPETCPGDGAAGRAPDAPCTVLHSTVLMLGSRSPSLGEASNEGDPQHGFVVNRLRAAVRSDRWSRDERRGRARRY